METFASFLKELTNNALPFWVYSLVAISLVLGAVVLPFAGIATYLERKVSADIQARIGPNRVGPYGILQFVADGIKLLMKEDIIPKAADKKLFILAPMVVIAGSFASFVVVPFSEKIIISDLNIGFLYLLAMGSLVGLGIIMAGWASNNKWSLLGGMRSAAQVISYEIPSALAGLSVVLVAGSLSFGAIVREQSHLNWYIFHNPFLFINFFIFFISALAEVNRTPFDIPEAESELVGGFHTEYSGMRFAVFFMAEYANVFVICAISSALFLGGWHLPFVPLDALSTNLKVLVQFLVVITKTLVLFYVVMWLRWTLPRYRVDQLLAICWKFLTPLAFITLIFTGIWVLVFQGRGLLQIIQELF